MGRGFALLALGFSGNLFEAYSNANNAFNQAALDPNYGVAWIGNGLHSIEVKATILGAPPTH